MRHAGLSEQRRRHVYAKDIEAVPCEERSHPAWSAPNIGHASTWPRRDQLHERRQERPVDRSLCPCAQLGARELHVAFGRRVVDGSHRRCVVVLRHLSTLRGGPRWPVSDYLPPTAG